MTSWSKRIGNCVKVIQSILDNTVKPDIVFLNLSLEEFPNRLKDLPRDLVELSLKNPIVKIHWVPGPNTKSMKKVFPILKYLDDNDMIITCDDDMDIPNNFVKVRVEEFLEHDQKFIISGGTNPKWHINKKLYNTRYNTITCTSIFQKKMLNGWERLICNDIVCTYNDDFFYTLIVLSNGYRILPSKYLSTKSGKTKQKILPINEVDAMHILKVSKPDEYVLPKFENQYFRVNGHQFKDSLFNLVIFDSLDVAGDNGEYFYRQIRKINPQIKMTFLLSRQSKDWDRLINDGFNLCDFYCKDIEFILSNSSYIVWSKDISDKNIMSLLYKFKQRSVFMGHGVTSEIYDDGFYFINTINNAAKYICCTSKQESNVINTYSKMGIKTIITGMPRHDTLKNKFDVIYSNPDKYKQIFITFHWRKGSINVDVNQFKSSQYLNKINMLLNDPQLKNIAVNMGVKVIFRPHAKFTKYKQLFNVPNYISCEYDTPFQDILASTDLLITDFSSNSFDLAYLGKKTIIYIPDPEYVVKYMTHYKIDKIEKYPHLVRCDFNDLFNKINWMLWRPVQDNYIANDIFCFVDTNNSKRLLEWLIRRYQNNGI